MTGCSLVYVTAETLDEARKIGRAMVEARLAACANLLPGMRSLYWWQDDLVEAEEAVLILKTRSELVGALIEQVKALHSYDCPCVVALPVVEGNPGYLDWIGAETVAE